MTLALERTETTTCAVPDTTQAALPAVVGAQLSVPLVSGRQVPYANLDHAASAPCLRAVQDAVNDLLPYYASVHRGAGWASQVCTQLYEQARDTVRRFVGAYHRDAVVFTRNTTDALNLLARAVPRGTSVVLFDTDHHAALLPWRGPYVRRIPSPPSPQAAADALDAALRVTPVGPRLVVVTGASNVTGELWPVRELAEVASWHGARTVLDAAQLAPHRAVDAYRRGVDYVVLSGHKLYAPFGAGALVGRADWLQAAQPYLAGGGASKRVVDLGDHLAVSWAAVPDRHEAGTPNVVGAHALAAACSALTACGWEAVEAHEDALLRRLRAGLSTVPGLRELALFGADHPRVGVVSCTIDGHDPSRLAAALSAEHGIGVRDGAFCAHIATRRLLDGVGVGAGGTALRASLGLGSTVEHVDRLVAALQELVANGPRWRYVLVDGRWGARPRSAARVALGRYRRFHSRQSAFGPPRFRVVGAQHAAAAIEGVLPQLTGFVVPAEAIKVAGQVVRDMQCQRIVLAECPAKPVKAIAVQFERGRHITDTVKVDRQAVRHSQGVRVVLAEDAPRPIQGVLVQRPCGIVFVPCVMVDGEATRHQQCVRVVKAQHPA